MSSTSNFEQNIWPLMASSWKDWFIIQINKMFSVTLVCFNFLPFCLMMIIKYSNFMILVFFMEHGVLSDNKWLTCWLCVRCCIFLVVKLSWQVTSYFVLWNHTPWIWVCVLCANKWGLVLNELVDSHLDRAFR